MQAAILAQLEQSDQARLLVISDSHGRSQGIARLADQIQRPDLVLHLGDMQDDPDLLALELDCPVLAVAGNCDSGYRSGRLPTDRLIVVCGWRIFMSHGHVDHVKHGVEALVQRASAKPFRADVICYGHTHQRVKKQVMIHDRPLWLLNPGSSAGIGRSPTGLLLIISRGKIEIEDLPELVGP